MSETIKALQREVFEAKLRYTNSKAATEELERVWQKLSIQLKEATATPSSLPDTGETKTTNPAIQHHTSITDLSYLGRQLLQPHQPPHRPPHERTLIWNTIFSFVGPTHVASRCRHLCTFFRETFQPLPTWTSFPHPNYPTLRGLMTRLNQLSLAGCSSMPTFVFIDNGLHTVDAYQDEWEDTYNTIDIQCSLTIIGASRDKCVLVGGFVIIGKPTDHVKIENMTICKSKANGVLGNDGASFCLENIFVQECRNGCWAYNTKGTLQCCEITQCRRSGVCAGMKGVIVVQGPTRIHHNCTKGEDGNKSYGLRASEVESLIEIVAPLTKEGISVNNNQLHDYGGKGTIVTVTVECIGN